MVFNELGRYEKMEDPEPRKAEELRRSGSAPEAKAKYVKAHAPGSVSVKTVRRSTTFVTAAVWITALLVVAFAVYKLFGVFTNG